MKKLVVFVFLIICFSVGYAQNADDITGIWWNDAKTSKIKVGKTYDCYVWLEGKDVLQLKGFVAGIRMLGRKSAWIRTTL